MRDEIVYCWRRGMSGRRTYYRNGAKVTEIYVSQDELRKLLAARARAAGEERDAALL